MAKLCFVTSNIHKYNEVKPIAESLGIELELCRDLKLEIQSDSIEEVVLKSAMIAYAVLSKPVLVEDAGLFIEALNGFPGPYSSYVYRNIGIKG
ncbi:MAG: non-canonical purine NTP pyrophosphatase, partial [Desulfurococcaceae archaeon]